MDYAQESWVKSDHQLARDWNFSGRKPSCSCQPQHCTLNISSHISHLVCQPKYLPGVTVCSIGWILASTFDFAWFSDSMPLTKHTVEGQSLSVFVECRSHACKLGDSSQLATYCKRFHLKVLPEAIVKFFRLMFAWKLPKFHLGKWTDHPSEPAGKRRGDVMQRHREKGQNST